MLYFLSSDIRNFKNFNDERIINYCTITFFLIPRDLVTAKFESEKIYKREKVKKYPNDIALLIFEERIHFFKHR